MGKQIQRRETETERMIDTGKKSEIQTEICDRHKARDRYRRKKRTIVTEKKNFIETEKDIEQGRLRKKKYTENGMD